MKSDRKGGGAQRRADRDGRPGRGGAAGPDRRGAAADPGLIQAPWLWRAVVRDTHDRLGPRPEVRRHIDDGRLAFGVR